MIKQVMVLPAKPNNFFGLVIIVVVSFSQFIATLNYTQFPFWVVIISQRPGSRPIKMIKVRFIRDFIHPYAVLFAPLPSPYYIAFPAKTLQAARSSSIARKGGERMVLLANLASLKNLNTPNLNIGTVSPLPFPHIISIPHFYCLCKVISLNQR